ncbi:MAG: glycolate oxidase subunit GlcF [Methylococcales bacterium]
MQTHTTKHFLNTTQGCEADAIIRSCVHCGFCTATCPTYQLLGDELDSPRGRIYLIKQMLEGKTVTTKTQIHLDRCLSCRACETTCPSGVEYGRLLDIGRVFVNKQVKRSPSIRLKRYALRKILPYANRFSVLIKLAHWLKPLLPLEIKQQIPKKQKSHLWPKQNQSRKMLVLQGCAQSVVTPNTNRATANILNKLSIELIAVKEAGCCGAVSHHLSAEQEALDFMRHNIDAWWPMIEQGIEAIVVTASGCGVMVKDYAQLLKHDPDYADKAKQVSVLAKDISEILRAENLTKAHFNVPASKVVFQSPCSLQHGLQLNGVVESLLKQYGFTLTAVENAHLCCGSAGTYSILEKELSQQLLNNKLSALQKNSAEIILTANIGCQLHLQSQSNIPVKHWIELLDECYSILGQPAS